MARITMRFNTRELQRNVNRFPVTLDNMVNAVMDRAAAKGEMEMKLNAPWHDRTGNARAGLHTETNLGGNHKEITFAHSVPYGIYLETIESGQWAIILKSMRKIGYEMMADLRFLLERRVP